MYKSLNLFLLIVSPFVLFSQSKTELKITVSRSNSGPTPITNSYVTNTEPYYYLITGSGYVETNNTVEITADLTVKYIDPDADNNGVINENLYGSGWFCYNEMTSDIVDKIDQMELKIMRLGGVHMSRYNWETDKYTFSHDNSQIQTAKDSVEEIIQACKNIGVEPLVQINAFEYAPNQYNGDLFEKCMSVSNAVDFLEYLNDPAGNNFKIKYFEIDNEPDIWHYVSEDVWTNQQNYTIYKDRFIEYAYALKKKQQELDPSHQIKIFGPVVAISWNFAQWTTNFLKDCYSFETNKTENPEGFRILDVFSFHYYPHFRMVWDDPESFIPEGVPAMLESVQLWWNKSYINQYDHSYVLGSVGYILPWFNQQIKKYYPGTELAITEVNVDSHDFVKYDPLVVPVYMADLYGVMAKYGMDYAMQYCLVQSGYSFPLISPQGKILPEYYPLFLYAHHFKGDIVQASSSKSDPVNVYTADNPDEAVIMVVNKQDQQEIAKIQITGYSGNAVNSIFFLLLEPYSLTCVKIPKDLSKDKAEVWSYGKTQILALPLYSSYNFKAEDQILDWPINKDWASAFTNVSHNTNINDGVMQVQCDFYFSGDPKTSKGVLEQNFYFNRDFSQKKISFDLYVPTDLVAASDYMIKLFIKSTDKWAWEAKTFNLDQSGWNYYEWDLPNSTMINPDTDLTKVHTVGFEITKEGSSSDWSGSIYLDNIKWE